MLQIPTGKVYKYISEQFWKESEECFIIVCDNPKFLHTRLRKQKQQIVRYSTTFKHASRKIQFN